MIEVFVWFGLDFTWFNVTFLLSFHANGLYRVLIKLSKVTKHFLDLTDFEWFGCIWSAINFKKSLRIDKRWNNCLKSCLFLHPSNIWKTFSLTYFITFRPVYEHLYSVDFSPFHFPVVLGTFCLFIWMHHDLVQCRNVCCLRGELILIFKAWCQIHLEDLLLLLGWYIACFFIFVTNWVFNTHVYTVNCIICLLLTLIERWFWNEEVCVFNLFSWGQDLFIKLFVCSENVVCFLWLSTSCHICHKTT